MTIDDIIKLAKDIVIEAKKLSALRTDQGEASVNYACIFTQSQSEYDDMVALMQTVTNIAADTRTGPLFKVDPISTVAGSLQLLKIRRPDPNRPERGDADFTIEDYATFKVNHLAKPGFKLIERENMEMIELIDPKFNVLAYYSHPPVAEVLKIRLDMP